MGSEMCIRDRWLNGLWEYTWKLPTVYESLIMYPNIFFKIQTLYHQANAIKSPCHTGTRYIS